MLHHTAPAGASAETLFEVISDAGHPRFNSAVAKVTVMAKDEHGAGFVGDLRTTL